MKRGLSAKLLQNYLNMYCIDGVMKVHTEARLFIKFLYENNIYNKFLYNFLYLRSHCFDPCVESRLYISHAFPWQKTAEGYKFWDMLDDRWRNTLERYYMRYLIYAC